MSIKKLFDKDGELKTILTSTDIDAIGKETESAEYIKSYIKDKDRFVPHVDFATASNFAKFGSAEQYYEDAIKRIYQTYPYDGSLKEKLEWHNSSSYFENYIFNNKYPRTTGYINFSPTGWGDLADGTSITNGYGDPATDEYILCSTSVESKTIITPSFDSTKEIDHFDLANISFSGLKIYQHNLITSIDYKDAGTFKSKQGSKSNKSNDITSLSFFYFFFAKSFEFCLIDNKKEL